MFNVPQFIDVEDKVAGPLTWKQLLWMIGMGAALLTFFNVFERTAFYVVAVPTVLVFVGLAFYKPNGIPMTRFIFYGVLFLFRPKISVWERPVPRSTANTSGLTGVKEAASAAELPKKDVSQDRLKELARILDSRKS